MKPLSDNELSAVLAAWRAPEPPPGLLEGVWARVDARPPAWYEGGWAFRFAVLCVGLLWLVALAAPNRAVAPHASDSLVVALARAGGGP